MLNLQEEMTHCGPRVSTNFGIENHKQKISNILKKLMKFINKSF